MNNEGLTICDGTMCNWCASFTGVFGCNSGSIQLLYNSSWLTDVYRCLLKFSNIFTGFHME